MKKRDLLIHSFFIIYLFPIRSKEGKFPHKEKLLNNQMKELNLVQSQMSVEELVSTAQIFTDLRSLKLGFYITSFSLF